MAEDDVPARLNKEFLENLLQRNENVVVSVTDYKIKSAIPEGENYLGVIRRVTVEYKKFRVGESYSGNESCSLIVKSPPLSELSLIYVNDINAFGKEIYVYNNILPAMYQIVGDSEIIGSVLERRLAPKFFPCASPNIIVLEDLKPLGYLMMDRFSQFNLEETLMVFKALARFHGLSVAVHHRYPQKMAKVQENTFHEGTRKSEQEYSSGKINLLASKIERWPGYEQYADKIRKLTDTVVDTLINVVKPSQKSLNVLNHGDCWVNNILFHYSSTGEIDDVRFIDYQMCRFSSPVLDLHYFIYTSVREEVRSKHIPYLLQEYHAELWNTLNALRCDPNHYTLQQLKEDYNEREVFGFITTITKLCTVFEEPPSSSAEDLENKTEKNRSDILIKDAFQKLLPYFESKGFL